LGVRRGSGGGPFGASWGSIRVRQESVVCQESVKSQSGVGQESVRSPSGVCHKPFRILLVIKFGELSSPN
jgi:hypothetical protein